MFILENFREEILLYATYIPTWGRARAYARVHTQIYIANPDLILLCNGNPRRKTRLRGVTCLDCVLKHSL